MSRKRARASAPPRRGSGAAARPVAVAPRRDPRRWIYGGLDAVLAAAYLVAIATVARSRFTEGRLLLALLPAFAGAAAVGTFAGGRWGWRVACIGCGGLLAVAAWLLLALCVDAAFLAGVYGAFGAGAATVALIAGLLVIELVALVPALQLKWLRTRAGRRAYGAAVAAPAGSVTRGGAGRPA
jgi:hypothetical protein